MSKKNEGKVTAVKADVVVSDVVTPVVAPVKDGRGAKFGVPHITDKVIQMTPEQREVWLNKCGTPEIRKDVSDRLTNILTNGRTTAAKSKPLDASILAGRTSEELEAFQIVIDKAIEESKELVKINAKAELEKLLVKFDQEKIRLQGLLTKV